jgi:hypothetical protein
MNNLTHSTPLIFHTPSIPPKFVPESTELSGLYFKTLLYSEVFISIRNISAIYGNPMRFVSIP